MKRKEVFRGCVAATIYFRVLRQRLVVISVCGKTSVHVKIYNWSQASFFVFLRQPLTYAYMCILVVRTHRNYLDLMYGRNVRKIF